MGLNNLFRRLTEGRSSFRKASKPGDLQRNCKFSIGADDRNDAVVFTSSPDILDSLDTKRSKSKKNSSPLSVDYPSCPALDVSPSVLTETGISGCCASSSSSSLFAHQQTPEKHQWFSRRKSGSMFLKSRRSTNPNGETPVKKLSWLPSSSPFLRAMSHSPSASAEASRKASQAVLPTLPGPILLKCLDAVQNPFKLFHLRALNRAANQHVQQRLERITEMDVRKINFDILGPISSESTTLFNGKRFYSHPAGHKVLMCFADGGRRIEILVDDGWTSRDVNRLHQILDTFRLPLRKITLDAPIFELIIASLSVIDLDRWYAFQCYMKAVNDFQIHLAVSEHPQKSLVGQFYWPQAESLIIRSTEHDSAHLSRALDYGVRSRLVMDRRRLETLKIILTDVEKMNRSLVRNLYRFRCWAGSAGFDDRFSQHCCLTTAAQNGHSGGVVVGAGDQRAAVLC